MSDSMETRIVKWTLLVAPKGDLWSPGDLWSELPDDDVGCLSGNRLN
jgi:hypothetical protein